MFGREAIPWRHGLPNRDPTLVLTFRSLRLRGRGQSRVYDKGPSRRDCLPGNQRSNMMTKDACLLCVGVYTAPSY